jgi:ketosteroid isomerase-like protein
MDRVVPGRTAQAADIALRLEAAFNARDAGALASLYSDTAVLMPPNEPMVRGRAAIERWFERALSRLRNIRVLATKSIVEGDRAFQAGTFTSSAHAGAASSSAEEHGATQAGKYVLFLEKHAGDWKIEYDIWNLDQPAG